MNFKYMNWMCMQFYFFLHVTNESNTKYTSQGCMLNLLLHYLEEIYYIKLFQVYKHWELNLKFYVLFKTCWKLMEKIFGIISFIKLIWCFPPYENELLLNTHNQFFKFWSQKHIWTKYNICMKYIFYQCQFI